MNLNVSHEWREAPLLTIQITAVAERLLQLTATTAKLRASLLASGEANPDTNVNTSTHRREHTHTGVIHSQIDIHTHTHRYTHSHSISQVQSSPVVLLHSTNSTGPLADALS